MGRIRVPRESHVRDNYADVTLLHGVARNSAQFPLVHRRRLVSRSRNNPELTVFAGARADNNVAAAAIARTPAIRMNELICMLIRRGYARGVCY